MRCVNGIKAARERIVARKDEDREDFLRKRGFSKAESAKIVATVLSEEGRPPESIYEFVQGITAFARTKTPQDSRLDTEGKIGRASCRERLCTSVYISVVAVALKKQHNY